MPNTYSFLSILDIIIITFNIHFYKFFHLSIQGQFQLIDVSPGVGHIFLLLHMLGIFYWILDIVTLALLGVGYICIFLNISEFCSGIHLSYLETIDPLSLISSILNHFFHLFCIVFFVF